MQVELCLSASSWCQQPPFPNCCFAHPFDEEEASEKDKSKLWGPFAPKSKHRLLSLSASAPSSCHGLLLLSATITILLLCSEIYIKNYGVLR